MKFVTTRRLALALGLVSIASLSACGGGGSGSSSTPQQTWAQLSGSTSITALQTTDTVVGTGATATAGNTLTVNYTGWLYDVRQTNQQGTQFDSSLSTGRSPFSFQLGAGQVIAGWDQGLVGMKAGGTRTLVIPASLAYGAAGGGNGAIPANAALIFTVQLISVQ
ncbi:MAG: FKBP-type peptidyl-prolyl cis-trans isomerase [Paucibacter sp.]|nr:FKBP-type peptidyl-prolyl cis-trans isomerase [Roseateles sp.]